ncbi:MAG: T9SS type A sorting domain-containing protein [Ignavibacteria bacterium]|nr:T9SS type A sorting domain-containing protein [Ignavibacteria bacterium]
MKYLIIFMILLTLTVAGNAQFGNYASYYPLQTGNTWYYKSVDHWMQQYFFKITVTGDTVAGGNKYFIRQRGGTASLVRFDTVSGNLLEYNTSGCNGYSNDRIIDSIASSPGNIVYCQNSAIYTRRCEMTGTESVLGSARNVIKFDHDGLVSEEMMYAEGIGVYYSSTSEPPPYTSYTELLGCRINGVVYGDTTMSSVAEAGQQSSEFEGSLMNSPNPFNPSTKIIFEIPVAEKVKLIVYDMLGKHVATLVDNEYRIAGSHTVEFNGASLASGMYFCRIEAGKFAGTRRMVMVK